MKPRLDWEARRPRAIRSISVIALLGILGFARCVSAAPTQEEVFKSIQDNVGSPTDSRKFLLYVCVSGGVVILLALFSQRKKREIAPKALNNHGKLLKEIMKAVPVRPREIRQLKTLAEQTPLSAGKTVQDPLTLLLCPSVLNRAVQNPRSKADRRVLQQVMRKIVMSAHAAPATDPVRAVPPGKKAGGPRESRRR